MIGQLTRTYKQTKNIKQRLQWIGGREENKVFFFANFYEIQSELYS